MTPLDNISFAGQILRSRGFIPDKPPIALSWCGWFTLEICNMGYEIDIAFKLGEIAEGMFLEYLGLEHVD